MGRAIDEKTTTESQEMMQRIPTFFVALCVVATMNTQQWYGAADLAAGNGPDLRSSCASLEAGRTFGSLSAGVVVGRDLASYDAKGLYFVELRGTQTLSLFDDGPQPYVCGDIGSYLDGRWVNEFGAGLCWPSGIGFGACSFGGAGYLMFGWTGLFNGASKGPVDYQLIDP
jgi:hypothetical protein